MAIEFRDRSQRAPGGEFRMLIGKSADRRELQRLRAQRDVLKDLAKLGHWDVLTGIKDGRFTLEEVCRAVDEHGLRHFRPRLKVQVSAPTLGELVPRFLDTIENRNTRRAYGVALRRFLRMLGEDRSVSELARHEVSDLLQSLAGELAQNSRAAFQTACSAFYTWWLDREASKAEAAGRAPLMSANPFQAATVGKVRVITTRNRFLTRDEYTRLLEVLRPELVAHYATCVWCGLRSSEFVHLRPEDIDLERRVVRIQKHPGRDGWSPKGYPRWTHGVRDIPVHRTELLPHLERYAEEWAGDVRFFANPRTGNPWRADSWSDQVRRDIEAAGLVYGRREGGITSHTFRHTIASWMAQADVQLQKIAEFLGDRVATVSEYYAHLLPSDLDETINRL